MAFADGIQKAFREFCQRREGWQYDARAGHIKCGIYQSTSGIKSHRFSGISNAATSLNADKVTIIEVKAVDRRKDLYRGTERTTKQKSVRRQVGKIMPFGLAENKNIFLCIYPETPSPPSLGEKVTYLRHLEKTQKKTVVRRLPRLETER